MDFKSYFLFLILFLAPLVGTSSSSIGALSCEQVFQEVPKGVWTVKQANQYWPEIHHGDLTSDEIDGVRAYIGWDYEPINQYLRTGDIVNNPRWQKIYGRTKEKKLAEVKNFIPSIDQVIQKSRPVPEGVVLFRTESYPLSHPIPTEGEMFTNLGFTSTSLDPRMAKRMAQAIIGDLEYGEEIAIVIQTITVPSGGLRATYAPKIIKAYSLGSSLKQEREVLLLRGLTYRVVKVEKLVRKSKVLRENGIPQGISVYHQQLEVIDAKPPE